LRDARHKTARGVFPLGKVGQLIAEGGAGKTFALCQLAVAVATGTRWLDTFESTKGRVLLVLGEEDAEESRRRLYHAANVRHGTRPDPGSIEVLPLAGESCALLEHDEHRNATETGFLEQLREYVQAADFRLVVVDPLSRFAGPDAEKDNAAATRFMQALESLAAPDRCILNAHHTNKLSRQGGPVDGSSGRGSSAFFDGARWQCSISVQYLPVEGAEERAHLGEVVTLAITKSNYAAKPEPVLLRRDTEHEGALVPIDDADRELVAAARRRADPVAARRDHRDGERKAREEREAAGREARASRHATEAADRMAREDAAAAAILAEHGPTVTRRVWYTRMRAILGTCSKERADDAWTRTGQ
jgi:RecA-family ATPase